MAPAPANTKDRFLDGVVPGNSEGKERDVLSIKDFVRGTNMSLYQWKRCVEITFKFDCSNRTNISKSVKWSMVLQLQTYLCFLWFNSNQTDETLKRIALSIIFFVYFQIPWFKTCSGVGTVGKVMPLAGRHREKPPWDGKEQQLLPFSLLSVSSCVVFLILLSFSSCIVFLILRSFHLA